MALCSACGTENADGRKFCSRCGSRLDVVCAACGAANGPDDAFCGECGAQLEGVAPAAADPPAPEPRPVPVAERRLVSVLFADLVGFTTISEQRDAEAMRDLQEEYFGRWRRVLERYDGTVEKFAGDAVMAVWGTPVAREDDAERAVRAAFEIVDAVAALAEDVRISELNVRVGIATGEAAVTVGAHKQGLAMVTGDIVNTAARIQSAARPGSVLVDESTRRAASAAIAYEDAGPHELKGKAEPVRLWRPVRVLARRGGEGRSYGLEAPFVGRDGDLRLLKELYHATADDRRSRLVSIVGVAGIGKSRLGWELYKYLDGLAEDVAFQRGRCLAYGDGVAFWALAEMIRMQAGIAENEDTGSARAKLGALTGGLLPDAVEREWVEPRLAHLLALEERTAPDAEDVFAAWRLYFERLAERRPVVLLFEDLHWGDTSLLDFVEYLLDWSRTFPIYVVTLARPELLDRRPGWGAGGRNAASVALEPLGDRAMIDLLLGLAPGLPPELAERIVARAEGIPLYAMETVRMLLDRGMLVRDGDGYAAAGDIGALDVPETLHALIAARLDDLPPEERRVLDDASVLGKTFHKEALAALSGVAQPELEPLLASLVRKEILSLTSDPRSPERGQYGFLQSLVQKIAHDTLSRRELRARHLAAARYFEESWTDDVEVVEVIASHYLDACAAAPDADDAAEIRARAALSLERAGEHATSLAAIDLAQRYFEHAAELAEEQTARMRLLERAGDTARAGGRSAEARTHLEEALRLAEADGDRRPAARISARLGVVLSDLGDTEHGIERMRDAFAVLSQQEPGRELALLASTLGGAEYVTGSREQALERFELALALAESLQLPDVLSRALNGKALLLTSHARRQEGLALMRLALAVALEQDLASEALIAHYNLGELLTLAGRYDEAVAVLRDGLALARRRGNRFWETSQLAQATYPLQALGEWDDALEQPLESDVTDVVSLLSVVVARTRIETGRGETASARARIEPLAEWATKGEIQVRFSFELASAMVDRAEGRYEESLARAAELAGRRSEGYAHLVDEAFVEAVESALALDDIPTARRLLDEASGVRPGERTRYLEGQVARLLGRLAVVHGDADSAAARFAEATASFREASVPFWLAVTLVEHGGSLAHESRVGDAAPLLTEAREILERLRAVTWLDRLAEGGAHGKIPPRAAV